MRAERDPVTQEERAQRQSRSRAHQGQSQRRRLAWDPGPLPSRPGPLGSSCRQRLGRAGVPSPGLPRCPMLSPMGWDQDPKGKYPKVMEESGVEWTLMARPPGIQSHTLLQGWVGVGGCRKGILIPSVSTPNRGAVGSLSNRGAVESPSNRGAVGSPPNRGREPAPGPLLSWRSPLCTRTSVPAPWSLVAVVSDSLRSHGL